MTSLGETYEKLMKFIRFFVNRGPGWKPFWWPNDQCQNIWKDNCAKNLAVQEQLLTRLFAKSSRK